MPGSLYDTSAWIAAVFPAHPFHSQVQNSLRTNTSTNPAVFCRSTQQSFLRLLTNPAVTKAFGVEGVSNHDALRALDTFLALPQVIEQAESEGTVGLWRQMVNRSTASPKLWMDAYLAAFAIAGGLHLVTLDRDFRNFEPAGLALILLLP